MPLDIPHDAPTLVIRREAFERVGLTRQMLDERLGLTPDEFRAERVVVVDRADGDALGGLIAELEGMGLAYFEDVFELSGNWPPWLRVFAMAR